MYIKKKKKKKKIHQCIGSIIKSNRQSFPPNQFRRIFSSPLHGYFYKIIHMYYFKKKLYYLLNKLCD